MNSPPPVARGSKVLRHLLTDRCCDVRELELPDFRRWLAGHIERWERDAVFAQREKIRDLRQRHPRLVALEKELRHAAAVDSASASHARLRQLATELIGADKAIAGLTTAAQRSSPDKREAIESKLASFVARRRALRQEQLELVQKSAQRQTLIRLEQELQQLRHAVGLEREQQILAHLETERGRRSGHRGKSFEQRAAELVVAEIVPELTRSAADKTRGELQVLHGVTLGAARLELDHLVLWQAGEQQAAEVIAIAEAKRNINDIAHGFRRRQENLAWLTGDAAGYDPRDYRTGWFASGHFERAAVHRHEGREFRFTRQSFRHFRRDATSRFFLDRLYWITRRGPIWGLSGAALHRLAYRVATDRRWDPSDEDYLQQLMQWCRRLCHATETPDVLRTYLSTEQRARQILLAVESDLRVKGARG